MSLAGPASTAASAAGVVALRIEPGLPPLGDDRFLGVGEVEGQHRGLGPLGPVVADRVGDEGAWAQVLQAERLGDGPTTAGRPGRS